MKRRRPIKQLNRDAAPMLVVRPPIDLLFWTERAYGPGAISAAPNQPPLGRPHAHPTTKWVAAALPRYAWPHHSHSTHHRRYHNWNRRQPFVPAF